MKKKSNKIKEYILYYIGNIFFKMVYIDDKEIINNEGEEEYIDGGYELRHRYISSVIFPILFLPLSVIKYIAIFISFILNSFFSIFKLYQSRIISDKKILSKKEKKYELTDEVIEHNGHTLHRIKSLKDFNFGKTHWVHKGDLGGFIESEKNLSQDGDCWVDDDAKVYQNAYIMDNACIIDNAEIFGDTWVFDNAIISDYAKIYDKAKIDDDAKIGGYAWVFGESKVSDNAIVCGKAKIYGKAWIYGDAMVYAEAEVYDKAWVFDKAKVSGHSKVFENANICGKAEISGDAMVKELSDYMLFKNNWSSGRYFTWTMSNNMWTVGCFYGTGEKLIEKAYKDSEESGKKYEETVNYVKKLNK